MSPPQASVAVPPVLDDVDVAPAKNVELVATATNDAASPESVGSDDTAATKSAHADLSRRMDALSLAQALLDFELANARVLDLTARLVEANSRVVKIQGQLDDVRVDVAAGHADADRARVDAAAAHAAIADLRASRTYRLAQRIAALARAVRR